MDTDNHIIVHMHSHNNINILRVVSVDHCSSYVEELKSVYNCEMSTCVCLYNCARWYGRLLDDLKYKRFKNVEMNEYRKGLWKVTCPSSDEWFEDSFVPYVKLKVQGYYEDEDEDDRVVDYLNLLQKIGNYNKIPLESIDKRFCETESVFKYTFKKPEEHNLKKGSYVLTNMDIMTMLLIIVEDEVGQTPVKSKDDKPIQSDFVMEKCVDFDGYLVNTTTFTAGDVKRHFEILNVDAERFSRIRLHDINYRRFVETNVASDVVPFDTWDATIVSPCFVDTVGVPIDSFAGNNKCCLVNQIGDVQCNNIVLDSNTSLPKKEVVVEEVSVEYYIYSNIIDQQISVFDKKINILEEFILVNSLKLSTETGREIFTNMVGQMRCPKVQEDFEAIRSLLFEINSNGNKPEHQRGDFGKVKGSLGEDIQKYHTSLYVDKYKDDSAETLASHAIEKVYFFLSQYIGPKDINMNKIGQDLVDLGVKKTRKAKGNIYGILNPSKEELTLDNDKDKTPKSTVDNKLSKRNYQLRKDPALETTTPVGPWNISSFLNPVRIK